MLKGQNYFILVLLTLLNLFLGISQKKYISRHYLTRLLKKIQIMKV